MTTEAKHWSRRVARPWRVVFVLYALALTVATHWPELRLGTETRPAPDKLIHMIAFGGLVGLLWRTRWLAAPWQVGVIVVAWAAADELSQGLGVLRRTVSWQDLVASQLGVVVALAWWWALAPCGGAKPRARLAYRRFIVDDLFARTAGWVTAGLAAGAGALLFGGATGLLLIGTGVRRDLPAWLVVAGCAGAAAGALAAVVVLSVRRAEALAHVRPCLECGRSCRESPFDDHGRGRCPHCAAPIHRGQWPGPLPLPWPGLRSAVWASLAAGALLVAALILYGVVPGRGGLAPDMQLAVLLSAAAVALAVGARVYRAQLYARLLRRHEG